eukprot:gnl/Dysnectes_brevis/5963_a8908_405.p1 GENE.gnl/Dysnectes_brevis/5963_a8908_405~~gnl/Dysnectes_brevis/5963_a8908_405.p1  ORF type:complete len:632 (+),score=79.47 gnl/Dysnectes_brevis/5963_a8908_405:115-2010(+)
MSKFTSFSRKHAVYKGPFKVGLSNLGQTCYMNSALQLLTRVKPINKALLRSDDDETVDSVPTFPSGSSAGMIKKSYLRLIRRMTLKHNPSQSSQPPLPFLRHEPSNILKTISVLHDQFSHNRQCDSHEFLALMIEHLAEDMNQVEFPDRDYHDIDTDTLDIDDAASVYREYRRMKLQSVVDDTLQCETTTLTECPCGRVAKNFQGCDILSIPVAKPTVDKHSGVDTPQLAVPVGCLFFPLEPEWHRCKMYPVQRGAVNFQHDEELTGMEIAERLRCVFTPSVSSHLIPIAVLVSGTISTPLSPTAKYSSSLFVPPAHKLNGRPHFRLYEVPAPAQDLAHLVPVRIRLHSSEYESPSPSESEASLESTQIDTVKYGSVFTAVLPDTDVLSFDTLNSAVQMAVGRFLVSRREGVHLCLGGDVPLSTVTGVVEITAWPRRGLVLPVSLVVERAMHSATVELERAYISEQQMLNATALRKRMRRGPSSSLKQCIDRFCSEELVEGYRCPSCRKEVTVTLKHLLFSCKQYVLIHLKRFESATNMLSLYLAGGDKNQMFVDYPIRGLTLPTVKGSSSLYDLESVVYHHGTSFYGHYTTTNRVGQQWVKFNDSIVSVVNEDQVVSSDAYMLLYKRRDE